MKLTIDWCERKTTSTGKDKLDCTITDETGNKFEHVTIWADFPGFTEIQNGHTIDGDVVTKVNGQYTNHTVYPIKEKKGGPAGIKAAQERKGQMIKEAQERKAESIAYFNALNSSIQLVSSLPEFRNGCTSSSGLMEIIFRHRDHFLTEWQKYEASDTTNKHQPF